MRRTLGLDCSSVAIGYTLLLDELVQAWGLVTLAGEIDARVACARQEVANLIQVYEPTIVIIESPAAVHAGGLIPQARVSGGVLLAVREAGLLWAEVTPGQAKKALFGKGKASKEEMLRAAVDRIGLTAKNYTKLSGKWWAIDGKDKLLCEDEADSLGVALAGLAVPVVNSSN